MGCGCGGGSSSSSSIDPYSPYPNCMNKITPRTVVAESTFLEKERIIVSQWWGGGGYFLVKDYWGCAARWGRIFTTGLTIMGLHF